MQSEGKPRTGWIPPFWVDAQFGAMHGDEVVFIGRHDVRRVDIATPRPVHDVNDLPKQGRFDCIGRKRPIVSTPHLFNANLWLSVACQLQPGGPWVDARVEYRHYGAPPVVFRVLLQARQASG
jgi:hypothetical protein